MINIIALVIVGMLIPSFSSGYIDLPKEHFAYEEINNLKMDNIVLGYPDNSFRPDEYITDNELITMLFRGANLDVCKNFKNWPNDYIELAVNNGIISDNSVVTSESFLDMIKKISIREFISNEDKRFNNAFNNKFSDELKNANSYITRAEACVYIDKLLDNTTKSLPKKFEVYLNTKELDISTIINSLEVFDYNSYEGKYLDVINTIKTREHPYLQYRDEFARGKKVVAIEFTTINNSEYGIWTSYDSLKFDNLHLIDAFDLDEINNQLNNCVYEAILIKPNESYTVTAFYVVDEMPQILNINRDINTLYNIKTHEYVDTNILSFININL